MEASASMHSHLFPTVLLYRTSVFVLLSDIPVNEYCSYHSTLSPPSSFRILEYGSRGNSECCVRK